MFTATPSFLILPCINNVNKGTILRIRIVKKGDENMKFDIIGDIHGCYDEFMQLIRQTWISDGYRYSPTS